MPLFAGFGAPPFLSCICKSVCFLAKFSEADACERVPAPIGSADRPYSASRTMIASQYYSKPLRRGTVPLYSATHRLHPATFRLLRPLPPPSRQCFALRPRSSRQIPSLFALLMSLSLSDLIGSSMRSIQLALYRQATPGRPRLPFGGSGFTVRSPMRLSALANQAPCNV